MADKQYYVKINFEYGVDNGDGTFEMKNEGVARWISMGYDNVVGFQNYAVIPSLNMLNTKAGELGLMVSGIDPESLGLANPAGKTPPGQAKK